MSHICFDSSSFFKQGKLEKILWLLVVILAFSGSLYLINNSYSEWQKTPIATNIVTHPLRDLDFPIVTVCPPEDSNTALYPDLMRLDNNSFSDDDRRQLLVSVKKILTTSTMDFAQNVLAVTNPENIESLHKGYQSFPSVYGDDGFEIKVGGIKGTITSPRFNQSYTENEFKSDRNIHVILDMKLALQNIMEYGQGQVVIDIEVDTREEEGWTEWIEYRKGPQFHAVNS